MKRMLAPVLTAFGVALCLALGFGVSTYLNQPPAAERVTTTPTLGSTASQEPTDAAPTTKTPYAEPTFDMEPNTANFAPGETIELFDRITIPRPKPWIDMDDKATAERMSFLERCGGSDCPQITFVDLKSGNTDSAEQLLTDWSSDPCPYDQEAQVVSGPLQVSVAGGKTAQVYEQRCGADKYAGPRYAWVVEGDLFVSLSGMGGMPEIVQGALAGATDWK